MVRQHFNDKGALREQYNVDRMAGRTTESFTLYKKRIRELRKKVYPKVAQLTADHLGRHRHTMIDTLSKLIGVICFTAVPDSLLMWAHYTCSHTGLVVEFDVQHPVFVETPRLAPVAYSTTRPVLRLGGGAQNTLPEAGWKALLTKSSEWEYEQEWRTTTQLTSAERVERPNAPEYFSPMPAQAIKSVILGARSSPELREQVLELARAPDWSHISVAKSRLHDTEYRLEIQEIEQDESTVPSEAAPSASPNVR